MECVAGRDSGPQHQVVQDIIGQHGHAWMIMHQTRRRNLYVECIPRDTHTNGGWWEKDAIFVISWVIVRDREFPCCIAESKDLCSWQRSIF